LSDARKPLKRDITQRRFKVLSANPKGFDRDGDASRMNGRSSNMSLVAASSLIWTANS